ncbi:MAG: lactonase family protein [Caulobacteraceae bacterium]
MSWRSVAKTILTGVLLGLTVGALHRPKRRLVFVGSQESGAGTGIQAAWLDETCGRLTPLGLAAEVERPTWLLTDRRRLYAVSEVGNAGDREGEVSSFAIDVRSGRLQLINRSGSGGGGATHLTITPKGDALFVANYGGGQVAVLPVAAAGVLGPVSSVQTGGGSAPHRRQQGPHAHGVTLDPSGRFLLAPDMGADRVFVYRFDPTTETLSTLDNPVPQTPPGSGPRLLLFGRDGRFAYLLTELSAEIFVFSWDAQAGRLSEISRLALDASHDHPPSAAALTMSRNGRRLYVSNRATNAIQVYAIDARSGLITEIQRISARGLKPWAAELSPSGRWLLVANQGSDAVSVFRVARQGTLSPVRGALAAATPTSVSFG